MLCIATARELTKKFEEVKKGSLSEILEFYKANEPKGEFVIIIEGVSQESIKLEEIASWESISLKEHMQKYISQGITEKDAMKQVAKDRGVSKRDIYKALLEEK